MHSEGSMKLILALSTGLLLLPCAFGQHGGSGGHAGGGFAHSSGAFSAGRSFSIQAPSAPRSFASASEYRPTSLARPSSPQVGGTLGSPPFGAAYGSAGRGGTGGGSRGPYRPYYSYARGVYLVPGWLNYGFYGGYYGSGYADDSGTQQQGPAAAPDSGTSNTVAEVESPSDYGPQMYGPPARPAYQPEAATPGLRDQPGVTLVFKDGRPPQQVRNYAVTRTTLYVLDGARRREIPLDDLDLPSTEKTNRDAGVDFDVPAVTN
jgi:hypothetical protein